MTSVISLEYIENMLSDKEIFSDWLKQKINGEDVMKGKVLAKKVGISPSTISGWFHGKSKGPPKNIAIAICKELKADYDAIISDYRKNDHATQPPAQDIELLKRLEALEQQINPAYPPPDNVEIFKNARNAEHHRTVDKFQDQQTALEINNILVNIESLEPSTLKKIKKTLQIELEALEETKRKDPPEPGKPGEKPSKRA